jgi:hypothetical protein
MLDEAERRLVVVATGVASVTGADHVSEQFSIQLWGNPLSCRVQSEQGNNESPAIPEDFAEQAQAVMAERTATTLYS